VKNGVAGAAAALLIACASAAACAEPLQTSVTLTVNPLTGHHEINGSHVDRLVFAPVPLIELSVAARRSSLWIEGLPPVTFGYNTSGSGAQSTRLGILNATYRQAFAGGWFVGAGQTIYNQFTTYTAVSGQFAYTRGFQVIPIDGAEAQYSRVTGARFEAGRVRVSERGRLEFWAAVNPRMRGIQYTRIPTFNFRCSAGAGPPPGPGCSQIVNTFADPENASQVDLALRAAHRLSRHGELVFGLRYLNYAAHYDDFPGQLADRNVGFAPLLGYRLKL
jgi:hypothetical protein